MAAEGRFFCWEKLSILYLQKNNQQSRKKEKDMERTTKKALGTMIGEMLQVEGLSGRQMYIIDVLCKINESREIASNTEYYYDDIVDKFEDFVVENDIEIWDAFNACNGQIDKLVLLNTKKLDEEEDIEQESRIITMARKTAANSDAYCLDLRVRLSAGCKRRYYFFFLYLPVFSYLRL